LSQLLPTMSALLNIALQGLTRHKGKVAAGVVAGAFVTHLVRQRLLRAEDKHRMQKKVKDAVSDLAASAKKKNSSKGEVNREFFLRLKELFALMVPKLWSRESLLLTLQAFFLFARTLVSIYIARLDGFIVKSLVSAEKTKFLWGLVYWCMIACPSTYINSMIRYLQSKIAIAFRTRLTSHVHNRYLDGNNFYSVLNLDSRLDNADQLITQDVNKFCDSVSALYSNLAKPILDVIVFSIQLNNAVGISGPLMMSTYYLVTGVILRLVTPAFGKLAAKEAQLEGDFRFRHSRIITNAEEIAFYGGQKIEKGILTDSYKSLISHVNHIYRQRIWHGMIEGMIIKYFSSVQGLIICALPVFWSDTMFGGVQGSGNDSTSRTQDYIRNRRYLLNLADAIGRILYSYKEVTELAGYTSRVSTMFKVLDDVEHGRYEKTISSANKEILKTFTGGKSFISDSIIFKEVPIVSPNGDVLVKSLSFRIDHGMHMIITGPNGCGKSSLFRTLGQLWPVLHGELHRPESKEIYYIPQRPYLRIGTLREQVIYPDSVADMLIKGFTDEDLMEILRLTHLSYIIDREGGWDTVKEWKDVLSGGEKQRMGMARLFYHKPKYAILDECTSQVSIDVEGAMYTHASDIGISLMTVSHRPSLWKYHDYVLQFDGQGNVEFTKLDVNHRMSLEEEKANLSKELRDVPRKKQRFIEICEQLGEDVDIQI